MKKRETAVMVQIWSIGERKFGADFRRRMIMFNTMVKSICIYTVEIWGIEEMEEIESIQERYLKNFLGLGMHTKLPDKRGYERRERKIIGTVSL